ncbi:MAG: hypothetical protein JXR83_04230 [Deltaproteobacteria bacterium]|nr:hypothetical protein [Deltaproteobacteria bacterium]
MLALAGALAAPAGASDADGQRLIEKARRVEAELEYDRAAELWLEVLALSDLNADELLEAHLHRGIVQLIRGDDGSARSHFRAVLRQQPGFELAADTSPKIQVVFESVREELGTDNRPMAGAPAAAPGGRTPAGPSFASRLMLGGWIAGGAGALALMAGTALLLWARAVEAQALASEVQVERISRYDQRDLLIYGGDAALSLGAVVVIGGAAVVAYAALSGCE